MNIKDIPFIIPNDEHFMRVYQRLKNAARGTCPECGGNMVLLEIDMDVTPVSSDGFLRRREDATVIHTSCCKCLECKRSFPYQKHGIFIIPYDPDDEEALSGTMVTYSGPLNPFYG